MFHARAAGAPLFEPAERASLGCRVRVKHQPKGRAFNVLAPVPPASEHRGEDRAFTPSMSSSAPQPSKIRP